MFSPFPRVSLILSLVLLNLGAALSSVNAQDAGLERTLVNVYNRWRKALSNKDAAAWAASIPRYRQVVTRNLIVSQRQPFPSAVFAVPLDPADVSGLRLVQMRAVGDTAHLLYFGKVNIGGDPAKIPDNLLMLKFMKEREEWRYDSSRMFNLESTPGVRQELQQGGTPALLDEPQFRPPGTLPPTPALCEPPQNMSGVTIQSFGYETRLNVNGFDYPVMSDHAEKLFVIGGLNNGRNDVRLSIKPTKLVEEKDRLLQLDFFVFTGNQAKPSVRVLHYQLKDANPPASVTLPLVIDAATMESGR